MLYPNTKYSVVHGKSLELLLLLISMFNVIGLNVISCCNCRADIVCAIS